MGGGNLTISSPQPIHPTMSYEEYVKIEFYKTYDVMTGIRIAATLGGFFSLMVLLVIYKSKCKSRSLSEENLEAAVAAAVVEEEQMELAFGKAFSMYGGGRRSLGNMSAPLPHTRFSSVGGGYNLFTPPVRLGYPARGRVSLPTSSPYIYPSPLLTRTIMDSPPPRAFKEDDEEHEAVGLRMEDGFLAPHLLQVPSSRRSSRSSRRLSSITCSSCDSSYLERRGSAMEMGRPIAPPLLGRSTDRLDEEPWDFYYPIDIQVIQPTPELSPCESQNSLFSCPPNKDALTVPRAAPLASISSCKLPSIEQDIHSVGSDSVFLDEELIDTEDEAEEFSTDSDAENLECDLPSMDPQKNKKGSKFLKECLSENRVPLRRYSTPSTIEKDDNHLERLKIKVEINFKPKVVRTSQAKTSSESDTIHASADVRNSTVPRSYLSVSCDHLVQALQEHSSEAEGIKTVVEHGTWSEETLF